jgi:hypothetical protein
MVERRRRVNARYRSVMAQKPSVSWPLDSFGMKYAVYMSKYAIFLK